MHSMIFKTGGYFLLGETVDTQHRNLKYINDLSGSWSGFLIYVGELEFEKNNLAVLN